MLRLVKTDAGTLPDALFIPIIAAYGPGAAGNETAEVSVSDCPFTVTITRSVPAVADVGV